MIRFFYALFAAQILLSCAPSYKIRLNTREIPLSQPAYYHQTSITETHLTSEEGEKISVEKREMDYASTLMEKRPDGSSKWRMAVSRMYSVKTESDTIIRFDTDQIQAEKDSFKVLIFKQLVSQPFYFDMEKDGSVSKFSGIDEIWAAVADSLEPEKRKTFQSMVKQMGDAFVGDAVKNSGLAYPSKSIRKGKTWKAKSMITLFNAQTTTTYRLDETFANELIISFTSVVKGDPEAPGELKMGPAKIKYYLNGTGKGNTHIDPVTGAEISSEREVLLEGQMEVKVPMLSSHKFPVKINTKTILTRQF